MQASQNKMTSNCEYIETPLQKGNTPSGDSERASSLNYLNYLGLVHTSTYALVCDRPPHIHRRGCP